MRPHALLALLLFALTGCLPGSEAPLFTLLSPQQTGITFANRVEESETMNPLNFPNLYNGGGVAAGDFNGDGKLDVYFTGNAVSNELYLNRGNFKFENATNAAGVTGEGRWCQGVAAVDINHDRRLDLYVCAGLLHGADKRTNLLYVNQGNDARGVPRFREMAAEYGLADTSSTTHAAFFDYDRDGDLDCYLLVDEVDLKTTTSRYRPKITDGTALNQDKFFRNDGGHFVDVTREVGIQTEGYGLGISVCDLNQDGYRDVFVSNDFITDDFLWINTPGNGGKRTFQDQTKAAFKHTSFTAMGNDVVDLNNDGRDDVIEMDMMAEDHFRRKQMDRPYTYTLYDLYEKYGYQHQYKRNTLQLNLGPNPALANGLPVFSEVAYQAGLAYTDWSWSPLCFDADGDGFRDVIITNGYFRDLSDSDFMAYHASEGGQKTKLELTRKMPQVKIPNYAYRNRALTEPGTVGFEDVSAAWGVNQPSYSHSAVYGDFDGDGDLDFIVNNLNEPAFVYRNNQRETLKRHFLKIKLNGPAQNPAGLGARVLVEAGGTTQHVDVNSYRGYLASQDPTPTFGLGSAERIARVLVTWPDGKQTVWTNVLPDQTLLASHEQATAPTAAPKPTAAPPLTDITAQTGLDFTHEEDDFVDFDHQKLLLHKFSQNGPKLAVGDVNGDGLDDVFVGGSRGHRGVFFFQKPNNRFEKADLLPEETGEAKKAEDADCLLFDADGDRDLDLFVLSDGYEQIPYLPFLEPRLFLNDGKGRFAKATNSDWSSVKVAGGGCVKAGDYDRDGDLDLFVGGRVKPNYFPAPVSSYLLRNEGGRFVDVTTTVAPALRDVGMVCDAAWLDFDGDQRPDLVLAGEFMPLTFLKQTGAAFERHDAGDDLAKALGFWNCLAPGDLDGDGDLDLVAGNWGTNNLVRPTAQTPLRVYFGDLNDDGKADAIPTAHFRVNLTDARTEEFPLFSREDMAKQLIQVRKQFTSYRQFSETTAEKMLENFPNRKVAEGNYAPTAWVENQGGGRFALHPLPALAQVAPVLAAAVHDVTGDGTPDLLLTGNDYGNEHLSGRQDAANGLVLRGDGKGRFTPLLPGESGFYTPFDTKDLATLKNSRGETLFITTENRGKVRVFLQNRGADLRSARVEGGVISTSGRTPTSGRRYRSTSPITKSSEPMMATRSATRAPRLISWMGERLWKQQERHFTLGGTSLRPSVRK